jgi:hypothetical protein
MDGRKVRQAASSWRLVASQEEKRKETDKALPGCTPVPHAHTHNHTR